MNGELAFSRAKMPGVRARIDKSVYAAIFAEHACDPHRYWHAKLNLFLNMVIVMDVSAQIYWHAKLNSFLNVF